jgi:hypothetical protein
LLESTSVSLPAIPPVLAESTVQLASQWSSICGLLAGASGVPASIAALSEGVIKSMFFQAVKLAGLSTILMIGVVGTVVLGQQGRNPGKDASRHTADAAVAPPQNAAPQPDQPPNTPAPQELDQKTRRIEQILDRPIDLKLEEKFDLDQFLKSIKQATRVEGFPGIPIYVSPIGLQEAEVSLNAKSTKNWLPEAKLRGILGGVLRNLRLSYIVKDGFLMIGSRAEITELRVEGLDRKLNRVLLWLDRVEQRTK